MVVWPSLLMAIEYHASDEALYALNNTYATSLIVNRRV